MRRGTRLKIDHYEWSGGREAMLRFGPATGPVAIVALPLFEEANRTRAFAVSLCRALAKRGVASLLPDLPGQGESLAPLETLSVLELQKAYDALIAVPDREGRRRYGVGIRSGALLDAIGPLFGRWHLAPQDGVDLLRDLTRMQQMEVGQSGARDANVGGDRAADAPVRIGGNLISASMLTELAEMTPSDGGDIPRRIVRLDTDLKLADRHVPGAPLWRRAEPDNDPALAALLADDIADWIATCER